MDEQVIKDTKHFAEIVHRYCGWAESLPLDSNGDILKAQKLLAELHLAVLNLPDHVFGDDAEVEDVSTEKWEIVRDRFSNLPIEGYWVVFDPTQDEDNEPVYGLLSDDLADIYQNIKYGLLLFEAGHIEEAIWEWKFNFNIHWGRHLVNAQSVIYSWLN